MKIGIETYPLKYVYMYIKNRETEKQAGGARDERKEVCSRETMENSAGETGKREGAREREERRPGCKQSPRTESNLRCGVQSTPPLSSGTRDIVGWPPSLGNELRPEESPSPVQK